MRVPNLACSCFFKHVGLIVKIYYEFQVNMFSNITVIKKIHLKSNFKKGHNCCKNDLRVISLVCTYSSFLPSNGRHITNCQSDLHDDDNDDDTKGIAIVRVFSGNSRAEEKGRKKKKKKYRETLNRKTVRHPYSLIEF